MGRLQAHTLFPLLTERNAPANAAQNTPAALRRKRPRRAKYRRPAPKRACTPRKSTQQKTRLSAFFDCGSNPHRKALSCAFNGAERACTLRESTQQKTRLSAGSNRFKWWT